MTLTLLKEIDEYFTQKWRYVRMDPAVREKFDDIDWELELSPTSHSIQADGAKFSYVYIKTISMNKHFIVSYLFSAESRKITYVSVELFVGNQVDARKDAMWLANFMRSQEERVTTEDLLELVG